MTEKNLDQNLIYSFIDTSGEIVAGGIVDKKNFMTPHEAIGMTTHMGNTAHDIANKIINNRTPNACYIPGSCKSDSSETLDHKNDNLIERVKNIYRNVTIDKDKPGDYHMINIEKILRMQKQNGGGPPKKTYILDNKKNLTSKQLKQISIETNTNVDFSEKKNVVVVGGGPVGLYTAIVMKILKPDYEIKVLEKRGDKNDKTRQLMRSQHVLLSKVFYQDFNETTKLYTLPENSEFYTSQSHHPFKEYFPNQYGNTVKRNLLWFLEDIPPDDTSVIPINILELFLGKKAQELGIHIIHSADITLDIITKYTNSNTVCVFDATGGRLFRRTFDNENTEPDTYIAYNGENFITSSSNKKFASLDTSIDNPPQVYLSDYGQTYIKKVGNDTTIFKVKDGSFKIDINSADDTSNEFQITTGNLSPENAVYIFKDILMISVGDTYMKTDWHNGNGLYFGFCISLLICNEIAKETSSRSSSGGNRKNHRSRKKKISRKNKHKRNNRTRALGRRSLSPA